MAEDASISARFTEIAVRTPAGHDVVQTPLMMRTADGLYINIHEAALVIITDDAFGEASPRLEEIAPRLKLKRDCRLFQGPDGLEPDGPGNAMKAAIARTFRGASAPLVC